ncbi:MAG: TIGR03862 family flavoprotein [Chloroflexota bacterium]
MCALSKSAVVVGGGPAGLIAAEKLLQAGIAVDLYDAMPSIGRKFLRAGKGGLNVTHSEDFGRFLTRYGERQANLGLYLKDFGPAQVRAWLAGLGIETFVGSSGRVFPQGMNSTPILRAWQQRLLNAGLKLHTRHRWLGWGQGRTLRFETPGGEIIVPYEAVVLALGGGSWPQLGSDGGWIPALQGKGIPVNPLKPANCGFDVNWSAHFVEKFHGQAVKPLVIEFQGNRLPGEMLITKTGVEGGPIYALSALLREQIALQGQVLIDLDLTPDLTRRELANRLFKPRGSRSLSSHLKRTVGIHGVRAGLLWEFLTREQIGDPEILSAAIKKLPLPLVAPRPLAEAISSAGGVAFEALNDDLMLVELPGVFCAGEMLDWEAPTGGYLLTACFATGRAAGLGAVRWLTESN